MRTAKRLIASAVSVLMCMGLLVPALTPAARAAETEPNYILSDKNIAAGKTATVSGVERYPDSDELTNFVGENLTDDDLTTRWSSEPASHQNPVTAQIDLGKVEKLARIELYWEAGDSNHFAVQVSKDAVSWNEVYKFQGTNQGVAHTDTIDLPQLTEARYVRLMAMEGGTAHLNGGDWPHDNVSLFEIKVYAGTENPAAAPVIGTQPEGAVYDPNAQAAALTVAATTENGSLSYQWYEARTNDNTAGTAIAGAVQEAFVPETAVVGTTYYYCVVTSTAGETTARTVSQTAPVIVRGNLALHKDVTASGVENYPNTDTPTDFTADRLTDGVKTGDSRWSSDPASAQDPAFAQIDLGRVETLVQIKLFWEAGDSDQFKVEISNNPENPDSWKQIYSFDQKNQGVAHTDVIDLPAETYARYLRLSATKGGNAHVGSGVWAHDNISLYEIEAYPIVEQSEPVCKDALNAAIEAARAKAEKDYTPESWAPLADALETAEDVNADPDASQEAVDAAQAELVKAMQALVKKPAPTAVPTAQPTAKPTAEPAVKPTTAPTAQPTAAPTAVPTAVPAAPTTPPTPPQGGAAQTGDTTNLMLWAVLTMVSGGAAATLYRKRRG